MVIADIRKSFVYLRDLPKNFEEKDLLRFLSIQECRVSSASLSLIPDVKACQYYLFSGTTMLEDFCLPIQKRGKVNTWNQWLKLQLFHQIVIQEAIWITDTWSRNYFHWILECLPRILAVRSLGVTAPILVPDYIYSASYVQDSLRDFGLEAVTFNFRQSVKINRLYLPSHDSPCAFDPSYIESVTHKYYEIDKPIDKSPFRKVFISRRGSGKRKILNENDLIPLLEESGFEIFQMENFSFRQQRDLMRETKILFSIHGAGLSNLIFLPKSAKVIELHPNTERYNSCFYHLAASLEIDYYYSFERCDSPNPQEANIWVNLENIKILLNSI